MSKLPKAPLVEVIFEVRWVIQSKELQEMQYLYGDLYQLLKEEYPVRETVNPQVPVDFFLIHAPIHRFRKSKGGYPLVQIGPGIMTVNTVDSAYFWEEYEQRIIDAVEKLKSIYAFKHQHNVTLSLQYIDLLRFNFGASDIIRYLEEYLHISIKQNFYSGPASAQHVGLVLAFPNQLGTLTVSLGRGKNIKGADGLAIQTGIKSSTIKPETDFVKNWLNEAHELCSNSFKQMTEGKLYESFKK